MGASVLSIFFVFTDQGRSYRMFEQDNEGRHPDRETTTEDQQAMPDSAQV